MLQYRLRLRYLRYLFIKLKQPISEFPQLNDLVLTQASLPPFHINQPRKPEIIKKSAHSFFVRRYLWTQAFTPNPLMEFRRGDFLDNLSGFL